VEAVVGSIVAVLGAISLYSVYAARAQEMREYGRADSHLWAWILNSAILLIGMGMGHAGAIFYARRLRTILRHSRKHYGRRQ